MGLDFDKLKIAKEYAAGRQLASGAIKVWKAKILEVVDREGVKRAVDLGCGVGVFLAFLQELFPQAKVIGIEPSKEMRQEAKKMYGERFDVIEGRAERLPLETSSQDLVFMKMVYHTLENKRRGLAEIFRVLRPGGHLVMKQFTSETNQNNIFWRFFPGSSKFADSQGDPKDKIIENTVRAGFVVKLVENVEYPVAENYLGLFERESQRGRSVYKLAPDDVWERDVENFRKFCKAHGQEGPVFDKRYLFIFEKRSSSLYHSLTFL